MADKVDLSLDDIIKQNKSAYGRGRGRGGSRGGATAGRSPRGGRGAGNGPMRNKNSAQSNRSAPYAKVILMNILLWDWLTVANYQEQCGKQTWGRKIWNMILYVFPDWNTLIYQLKEQ